MRKDQKQIKKTIRKKRRMNKKNPEKYENKAVRKMEAMIKTKQITKQNQRAFKILPFM